MFLSNNDVVCLQACLSWVKLSSFTKRGVVNTEEDEEDGGVCI